MEANIIFENVKAYNVVKFDVKLNEKFKIELVNGESVRWFADNDSVLHIKVEPDGQSAIVEATGKGVSEIQLQKDGAVVKTLQAEVYDIIATSLNLKSSAPVLK